MTKTKTTRLSEAIEEKLRATRQRAAELERRREQLDAEIDGTRARLGKAMAIGDEDALQEEKNALRAAEDESEGAERALAYLADETERLEAEPTAARAEEAMADRDAKVAEAIAGVDELAASLAEWLDTFLPLVDRATSLTQTANQAELDAAYRVPRRAGRDRRVGCGTRVWRP